MRLTDHRVWRLLFGQTPNRLKDRVEGLLADVIPTLILSEPDQVIALLDRFGSRPEITELVVNMIMTPSFIYDQAERDVLLELLGTSGRWSEIVDQPISDRVLKEITASLTREVNYQQRGAVDEDLAYVAVLAKNVLAGQFGAPPRDFAVELEPLLNDAATLYPEIEFIDISEPINEQLSPILRAIARREAKISEAEAESREDAPAQRRPPRKRAGT